MTNQEKFIQTFGIDAWQRMMVFSGIVDQFTEFWTSVYNESSGYKGHWVHKGQSIYCSECGKESGYNPFGASRFSDYCPNCGAEMVEPQEKRCADCNNYGKLSLDCGRCDDDCSMFESQERSDKE